MCDEKYQVTEIEGFTGYIVPDDMGCSDPRKEYNHLAVFVCGEHRDYTLGDTTLLNLTDYYDASDFSWSDASYGPRNVNARDLLERYIRMRFKPVAFEWVGLLDHSGISLYAGGGSHMFDTGGWDSGTVGFAMITYEDYIKEYGKDTKENREAANRVLNAEIEEYSAYLSGDVWGYVIEDGEGDIVDSCSGFIGSEWVKREMLEQLEWFADNTPKQLNLL